MSDRLRVGKRIHSHIVTSPIWNQLEYLIKLEGMFAIINLDKFEGAKLDQHPQLIAENSALTSKAPETLTRRLETVGDDG